MRQSCYKQILRWVSRLTLGAVVLLLAVGVAPVCAQDDEWLENLNAAKAQARGEGRPLLILFVLEGCPECARMERSLAAPGAKRALEPFVKVRLEFYEHRDLALRYGIEYTPTLLVYLPSDGFSSCRERHVGALSPASLQRLSQRILSQCAKAAQSQANAEIVKTPATTNPPSVTPTLSWQVSQRYLSEKPTRKDRSVGLGLADVYHNVVNH